MDGGRKGRNGPLYRRTLGPTGNWSQVEDGKGGNQIGEGRHGSRKELLGPPTTAWEGIAYQQWRPTGGSDVQVDNH